VNLLLLAAPGAGKGTQGVRLAEAFAVPHISTGDLLRHEVAVGTELGRSVAGYLERGELVPDDVVIDLVTPYVIDAVRTRGGYLLDGFPRSRPQALAAYEIAKKAGAVLHAVVYLAVPGDELVRRLLQRAEEENRPDDTEDVIRRRLELYVEQTRPLLDYYRERGIVVEVDGDQPVDQVTDDIMRRLKEFAPEQLDAG
jgi:adenylate kinase